MRALLAFGAALALSGCADGLQFREDDRVRFVRPPDRAEVTVPLVVDWTAPGIEPGAGIYAVFVDRAPMPPGEDVDDLAEEQDPACARARACPDTAWLERHDVYLVQDSRVAIPVLPDRGRPAGSGRRRHEITVVLLDRRGVRRGESAWTRTVYTREPRT